MTTDTYDELRREYIDLRRDYTRLMVLAAVTRVEEHKTAGELSDFATAMAMAEGHPKDCWAELSPQTVSGLLRQLEKAGSVVVTGVKRSTRYGRDEPLWAPREEMAPTALPMYPEPPVQALHMPAMVSAPATIQALVAADPLETLTREQLLSIIQVGSDMQERVDGFLRDMQDLANRAKRALSARDESHG